MIVSLSDWMVFASAALAMVITPGPNMMYLVSRCLCQGRSAAIVSLFGVAAGFLFHMTIACFGLSAVFLAIPFAYNTLKLAGAGYLLWLAWQAVRPGSEFIFRTQKLESHSAYRLLSMGFFTNVLNPKIAVFYISIFSQFLHPEKGSVVAQGMILGATQICISFAVNFVIIMSANEVSAWFAERPLWVRIQKWFMASVLSALALKIAVSKQK